MPLGEDPAAASDEQRGERVDDDTLHALRALLRLDPRVVGRVKATAPRHRPSSQVGPSLDIGDTT